MGKKVKGLQEFLAEDRSLMETVTDTEFQKKKAAPGNTDEYIDDAFQAYCSVVEKK